MRFYFLIIFFLLTACDSSLVVMENAAPKSKDTEIFALSRINVQAGDEVRISGQNLHSSLKVQIGDELISLQIKSSAVATFLMPDLGGDRSVDSFQIVDSRGSVLKTGPLQYLNATQPVPVLNIHAALVCSDINYKDASGNLKSGERNCSSSYSDCKEGSTYPCRSTASFPPVDLNALDAKKNSLRASVKIVGISGTLIDCVQDGDSDCLVVGPSYAAALIPSASNKIVLGQSIAGVSGTAVGSGLSCAIDGGLACAANTDFPAMLALGASSKFIAGHSLGGITGQLLLPSANEVAAGISYGSNGNAVTGLMTLPLASTVKTGSPSFGNPNSPLLGSYSPDFPNLASVSQNATVDGSAGLLLDCASDNQSGCLTTAGNPSVILANIAADSIKTGVVIAGVTGTYPSASNPLAANTGMSDLTSLGSQMTSNADFEYFDSKGLRYTASGDSDIIPSNIRAGIAFENLSLTGALPATALAPPMYFLASYASSPNQVNLSWERPSGTGVIVVSRVGAAVNFVPQATQIYSPGAQGSNTILYVGALKTYADSSITPGTNVYYSIYSYDANHYYSETAATAMSNTTACSGLAGGDWVLVPGDATYGTKDFCMMRYEAKKVASSPYSQAAQIPWVNISQNNAVEICHSLGARYYLMTNDQWMTAASNLAAQNSNWTLGTVGSGSLFRGHSDKNPNNVCEASTNNSLAYVQTDCIPAAQGTNDINQRRTHSLSNGQVVWDMAGNAAEFTSLVLSSNSHKPYASTDGAAVAANREFPLINSNFAVVPANRLVPRNAEKSFWNDSWNSGQGIGQYFAGTADSMYLRGRSHSDETAAGLFGLTSNLNDYATSASYGFRCSYVP